MKNFILSVLGFILLTSCQQDLAVSGDGALEVTDTYAISKSEAEKVATRFMSEKIRRATKSQEGDVRIILNSFPLKDEANRTFLHTVNFEGGGFTLISGDNRIEPVLAYSDEGYFNSDTANYPGGLKFWLACVKEEIKIVQEAKEAPDYLQGLWNKYLAPETKAIPPVQPCSNLAYYYVAPLTTTIWGQRSPYNLALPTIASGGDENGHVFVGCTTVAVAQILRYHQLPSSYQWSQMPNSGASTYTKSLMLSIHNFIHMINSSYPEYLSYGTNVPTTIDLGVLFRNYFGYSSATQGSYSWSTLRNQLLAQKPVILRGTNQSSGNGHAWVCDGYEEWEECLPGPDGEITQQTYARVRCNCGWNGQHNAWYGYNFSVDNTTYSVAKMVYNIQY